jgi:glucosylceramidase
MKWTDKTKSAGLFSACFLVLIAAACGDDSAKNGTEKKEPGEQTGDVTVFVTTNNRSYDFKKQTVDFSKKENLSPATIRLNPEQRYQEMDGFGAAITGSTAYNLLQMKPEDRTKFLKETFSETEGMGYSYIRVAIGCSDFSLSEYTCRDDKNAAFALTSEENDYVIPVLKEILAIHPGLKILASPWTCPRWMKVNDLVDLKAYNSWTGGHLNPTCYADYAGYFVDWLQTFAEAGVPVYAVTPQNEPLNRGNSASLFMGWQEQRDFVKEALSPKLKDAGLNTKIYLFDHNYNYDNMPGQDDYPARIYDAGTDGLPVAGAAYHNYGGNREELADIHSRYPGKELIFTETSIGTWNDGRNLAVRLMEDMREIGLGTVDNWCKAVIVWNLMLDSERGPNREGGCQTCYGAVDIDRSDYGTITRNSHYYVIGHLSSVVKPGAIRIGAGGYTAPGVSYTAFENTNGTYALVLLNNTSENKKITIDGGSNHFSYDAPAKSIVSCQWKK